VKVKIADGIQVLNLQLKVALAAQHVTVEDRAATVTPEPANNVSATVLAGNDLEALSDNPDDLIADLTRLPVRAQGRAARRYSSTGFPTGRYRQRRRFARSASIRIRFRRNTTRSARADRDPDEAWNQSIPRQRRLQYR
jgi:hypothetical protein